MMRKAKKKNFKPRFDPKRPRANQQIRVPEVQVIDETGQPRGVMPTHQALTLAREAELDLVEVGASATPPIVKILDFGKFMYQKEKNERESKRTNTSEIKAVRITFRAGEHDLGIRAKQTDGFLEKGHRVRIDMKMRGREKAMRDVARTKLGSFLTMITAPHMVDGGIKSSPMGMSALVVPQKK